jgi:hypothetical protein
VSRITKCELPVQSLLHSYVTPGDFVDCYRCESQMDIDAAAANAMAFPGWVNWLLRLRNVVVKPLGLSGAQPKGDTIGHFPVDRRNETEVILGFDDSHLNFRISVLVDGTHAYAATWVHRNNALGRAYLAVIMPFHIVIMRNAIGQVASASQAG